MAVSVISLLAGVASNAANRGCIAEWNNCTPTIMNTVTSASQPTRAAESSRSFGGRPRVGGPASVVGVGPDATLSICRPIYANSRGRSRTALSRSIARRSLALKAPISVSALA